MTTIPSDLPEPVGVPSGPVEEPSVTPEVVEPTPGEGADSLVGLPELKTPPPVASTGEVVLAIETPWYTANFNPSLPGCPVIAHGGTPVPAQLADQAISIGAANGVTIVKR